MGGTRAPLQWAGTSLPLAWLLLYPRCRPCLWAPHPPSAHPILSRDGSTWGGAGSPRLFGEGLSRVGGLSFPSQTWEEAACAISFVFFFSILCRLQIFLSGQLRETGRGPSPNGLDCPGESADLGGRAVQLGCEASREEGDQG